MAETESKNAKTGADEAAKPASAEPVGDRVASLSIRKDGTPDQLNPVFIGDPETTERTVREQFRQMAVSAADERLRSAPAEDTVEDRQDPTVAKLWDAHEAAAKQGEAAADAALRNLGA